MADRIDRESESESQPLLNHREDATTQPIPPSDEPKGFTRATYFALWLTLLLEMSNVMLAVPIIALYEQVICRNHYGSHQPSLGVLGDDPCKAVPVQSELALLRGWQGFFNGLAALLAALPLGYFADHHSHRATLSYILAGMLAALFWVILVCTLEAIPVRLVWLTSVFLLCGGGNYGAEMLLAVILVNSTSEANRTRALYYQYSTFIFTELVGPQLSKWTLNYSIWLSFGLGVASLLSCFPLLALTPESKTPRGGQGANDSEAHTASTWEHAWHEICKRLSSVRLLFHSRNICFSVPLFLVGTFRNVSLRALLQYVSVRFHWALSDTNWLITEVASVNLVLFFVILPSIIYAANRWLRPHQQTLNLRIVQCSFVILGVGSAAISLSRTSSQLITSLGFYAFGFGARATLLSLVTYWFDKEVRARLYSAILLLELVGMLSGEAILQSILSVSFSLPHMWMGVAFLFCTGCYSIAFLSSFGVRLKLEESHVERESSLEAS